MNTIEALSVSKKQLHQLLLKEFISDKGSSIGESCISVSHPEGILGIVIKSLSTGNRIQIDYKEWQRIQKCVDDQLSEFNIKDIESIYLRIFVELQNSRGITEIRAGLFNRSAMSVSYEVKDTSNRNANSVQNLYQGSAQPEYLKEWLCPEDIEEQIILKRLIPILQETLFSFMYRQ